MRIGRARGRLLPWPVRLTPLLALLTALFCGPLAAADDPGRGRGRLIVVLYPNAADGRPGNSLVDRGIRAAFAAAHRGRVEIHNEYLDAVRLPDADYQQQMARLLRRKYAGRKVDLIITGLAPALDYALKYRHDIFPDVPIVYCAVEQEEINGRNLPADVIGTPIRFDLAGTLEVAIRLHPDTQRVYVIAGQAKFDAHWVAEARRAFRPCEDSLEFVYWTGQPMERLLEQVGRLPPRSLIYYLHVFEDGAGTALVPAEVLEQLARAANAPIYGHVDSYVGRGMVGGSVFSFETEGRNAARLGLRLLAGERPQAISAPTSENTYLFDWRQLRRWGISESHLPGGSVVRNKEPNLWDLYRWHILGVASLCVVQTLLIAGLLVQRASRRRAELRFRLVVEAAPNGMLMVGPDGTILLANAQLERLFGYAREDLLGRPIELLLADHLRQRHAELRRGFFAAAEVRPMGMGRDLFGRRKDGSEFPVEVGLSPVQTELGLCVLASVVDITERRQALDGLRESQRELRALTGKLLQAQETERRRIARELHDDLGQNLALLSVELGMLGQRPPETAAHLGERVRELLERARQLSSAVHDLSHQLHPSKLEQLGLLAAVRGLCKELTHSHGLPIGFAHRDVPDAIPQDTALALYRIAQEALQNVIKHSGASHAEVELCGGADVIGLRVVDDGTGFDPGSVDDKGGLGLVGMRERLRLVGGELAIDSRAADGTRIDVRVPWRGVNQPNDALKEGHSGIG